MSTEKCDNRGRFWGRFFRRHGRCCKGRDPAHKAEKMVKRMTNKLQLDDSQQTHLLSLKDKLLSLRSEMQGEKADHKKVFLDLLAQSRLDQDKAMAMITEKPQAMESRARELIAVVAEFADDLSDAQRRQLMDILESGLGGFRH